MKMSNTLTLRHQCQSFRTWLVSEELCCANELKAWGTVTSLNMKIDNKLLTYVITLKQCYIVSCHSCPNVKIVNFVSTGQQRYHSQWKFPLYVDVWYELKHMTSEQRSLWMCSYPGEGETSHSRPFWFPETSPINRICFWFRFQTLLFHSDVSNSVWPKVCMPKSICWTELVC